MYTKRSPLWNLLPGFWSLDFCRHKVTRFSTYLAVGTLQLACRQDSILELSPVNLELQNRNGVVVAHSGAAFQRKTLEAALDVHDLV